MRSSLREPWRSKIGVKMRNCLSIVVLFLVLFVFSGCIGFKMAKLSLGEKVALVEVKGVIAEPDEVVEDLEKARKDKDIKAVVVRVDSPGGSVGASQEIFRTIRMLDKEKPVVASMGDVAASGGYYVSAGARKIFANEGTVTGSIGVRMEHVNARQFFEFIKMEPETLKSGDFKDLGSFYRALKPEERKILEDFLAELHGQFKSDVAKSRKMGLEVINKIADGRIYTGLNARGLGLVDEIGGLVDAVKAAGEIAGIRGEPRLVKMRKGKPWWYDLFTERAGSVLSQLGTRITGYKYFLYEWKP